MNALSKTKLDRQMGKFRRAGGGIRAGRGRNLGRFFAGYLLLRLVLFNLNATEWGDSFRMLRAAREILDGGYPLDEKRLPLFSLLLAPAALTKNEIGFARFEVLVISLLILYLTYLLAGKIFPKMKGRLWVLVLTALNPIFFYWSLRIMAGPLLTLLVLLSFYIFYTSASPFWLGLLAALACLTRYEGIFLAAGFFLYFAVRRRYREAAAYLLPSFLLAVPWLVVTKLLVKGQTSQAYFTELATFTFDWNRLKFFIFSYLFLFVAPLAAYLIFRGGQVLKKADGKGWWEKHLPLLVFIGLETAMALVWTPSVPRILLPLVPLLAILAVAGWESLSTRRRARKTTFCWGVGLTILYALGQYWGRYFFLGLSRANFLIVLGASLGGLWAYYQTRRREWLMISMVVVMAATSLTVTLNQRRIYETIRQAVDFANQSDCRRIGYFDETGVTSYYLNPAQAVYLPQDKEFTPNWVAASGLDCVIITNEFNRGSQFAVGDLRDFNPGEIFGQEIVIADFFDSVLIKAGVLPSKEYPVLWSHVYRLQW